MDANMKKRNELLAKTVIKGLESRNMSGYYAQDKEAALKQALELIPNGSTIAMGGCMSAHEIGLVKALQDGDYNFEEFRVFSALIYEYIDAYKDKYFSTFQKYESLV